MASKLNEEQLFLCGLLAAALNGRPFPGDAGSKSASLDMGKVLQTAERHRVLPLLHDLLCESGVLGAEERSRVEAVSRRTVRQSYRLLFLTRYLIGLLERERLPTVVLKGCGASSRYPVPELRKAGDVDLLVRRQDFDRALAVLEREGYRISENQHANHHRVLCSDEGIDVELHIMPAEPFNDAKVNARMEELTENFVERRVYCQCMGVELPVLPDACQALQLLLHMLQHFLRAGFGLRLLCDWTAFWNAQGKGEAWEEFGRLAKDFGVSDFAGVVTACCAGFLGLWGGFSAEECPDGKLVEEFLCDVFEAEEFGQADVDRMVAVQGKGIRAYWREFHYQMKMNHPRASKYVLLWPALWGITLIVFVYNNRRLKRGTVRAIMRSAGKRGRLVRQMGLWGKTDEDQRGL